MLAIGPVIRHFYNMRHQGRGSPWWTWGVAAAGMIAVALLSAAGPRPKTGALPPTLPAAVEFAQVEAIVSSRCSMCHAAAPLWPGIASAPKGVRLDDADHIRQYAALIDLYAVRSHAMPPGNITDISLAERDQLAAWVAAGAPAK